MLGERLKILRENKELLQKDVALAIGVSDRTIGMYEQERREPDLETLNKLADYFNVTSDYLLGRTDKPNTIMYSGKIDATKIEFGVDKKYPHDLTPEDIDNLFEKLKEVGFDLNKLIEKTKQEL
jgi:transcriptional regulator with XRE-family HTH domain